MIKIVAIKTLIAKTSCTNQTLVNIFQLVYVVAALIIIANYNQPLEEKLYICTLVLFVIFVLRLMLKWFPKICGECKEHLVKSDSGVCPECGSYNVYDLKCWSKLQFNNAKAAHKAEISHFIQNIVALIIILLIFSLPLLYFFLVIDKDIRQLNEQRRFAFIQTRPAFLKYRAEHHKFPSHLEQLIPDYLFEIPSVLMNTDSVESNNLKINYRVNKGKAKFIFHVSHGFMSAVSYDISADKYKYDSRLAKLLW